MTIEFFLDKLAEVRSAPNLESSNLFELEALALNTKAQTEFQKVCLFIVASAFSRLATRLESESVDTATTADYEYLFSLIGTALRARSYDDAQLSLVSIVEALSPLTPRQ